MEVSEKNYDVTDRIVRKPEARHITGLSDPTMWRQEQRGLFPKRRRLTNNGASGWLLSELMEWIHSRK